MSTLRPNESTLYQVQPLTIQYDLHMITRQRKAIIHYKRGWADCLRWIIVQKSLTLLHIVNLFFVPTSQRGRTNGFDSKQLLSGNYPGIMYHHVITPDKIQSFWKIICTVCLISKPFRCLNLWEKTLRGKLEQNIIIKKYWENTESRNRKNVLYTFEVKFHNPIKKNKHCVK